MIFIDLLKTGVMTFYYSSVALSTILIFTGLAVWNILR